MTITLQLNPEMEAKLRRLATQAGQTMEGFIGQLLDKESLVANGSTLPPATAPQPDAASDNVQDEEEEERPWRGVFVPPRERQVLFTRELNLEAAALPKREAAVNMGWHRVEPNDG
jgi:hypothetical protein